jgi:protein subunit release factor A
MAHLISDEKKELAPMRDIRGFTYAFEKDCVITVADNRPYGGQQVGSIPRIVTVTHTPSGISATCGAARSQYQNKNLCMEMIERALCELKGRGM